MYHVQTDQSPKRNIIKLVKFSTDDYAVFSYDSLSNVRGDLRTATKALRNLGVQFDSIETAHVDLETLGHNVAEFGVISKSCMYTYFDERHVERSGVA